ncbi:MAG: hypothetical protein A3I02_09470 [Betaproteobacteria bacterium RIFCSPLOWO2_02_FULL_67_26]|nr:MAG: hypothetical protein A3I02_09470 [Betaproteobacteria bacterium RIFCSPLOWO2_02_FULL_67_26]
MADKLLIGVSTQGAIVAFWHGRRIVECQTFADDAGGRAGFKQHLAQFSNVPVHIMVDAVEEDYRFETLPHATGGDRADMVGRKLKQHYRNTPYMAASFLGRESGKRRDDRFLFAALTNPELIGDWLQEIVARELPVAGIHLLPTVSEALPDKLDVKATNLLLVAQHPNGLRLTFFRDRQFRLSRLTRGDSGRAENRVRYFAEEISNTRLYLHALRTMTLDEQLAVVLIDRGDELAEVATGVTRENPSLACERLGRKDLAARLGFAESLLDASPYVIYLHLLGLKEPQTNLAPANVTVGYRRYQARRSIYAGCGVLAAAAAVWTGVNFYQMMMLRGEAEDAARQASQLAAQYSEITRQFPQAPASAENLKKTVEIAQKLRDSLHTPQRMMTLVSRALEANPAVVIREFGWKYGATEIEAEGAGKRAAGAQPPGAPPPAETPSAQRRESALIEGEIRPFRGDFRSAIVAINGFAGRLSKEPEVAEARVVKLPLDVDPSLSLSGNTLDNPEQASGSAHFKLLVVLKPAT